ncbi:MAG: hypothetical protein ACE15C_21035 [Phycisphaerae bacterium]
MKPFDYAKYGKPGTPIPGSRFVRGYCPICGAPVRTSNPKLPLPCFDCDGHERPGGSAGPIDDVTGYQANAVRALEN